MKIVNNLLLVIVFATALILMPIAIVVVAFGVAKSWLDTTIMGWVLK